MFYIISLFNILEKKIENCQLGTNQVQECSYYKINNLIIATAFFFVFFFCKLIMSKLKCSNWNLCSSYYLVKFESSLSAETSLRMKPRRESLFVVSRQ